MVSERDAIKANLLVSSTLKSPVVKRLIKIFNSIYLLFYC